MTNLSDISWNSSRVFKVYVQISVGDLAFRMAYSMWLDVFDM